MNKVVIPENAWRKYDTPEKPGWYIASTVRSTRVLRWWDGSGWSQPAGRSRPAAYAAIAARIRAFPAEVPFIMWLPQEWITRLYPEAVL